MGSSQHELNNSNCAWPAYFCDGNTGCIREAKLCVSFLPLPKQDFQLSLPQHSSIPFELLHFGRWAAKCLDYLAQREVWYWLMFYLETDFLRELYVSMLSDVLGKGLE